MIRMRTQQQKRLLLVLLSIFRKQSLESIPLLCLMKAQKSHVDDNDEENFVLEENQTQRALNMPSLELKDVQVLRDREQRAGHTHRWWGCAGTGHGNKACLGISSLFCHTQAHSRSSLVCSFNPWLN